MKGWAGWGLVHTIVHLNYNKARANPQKSQKAAATKKNEKPTMTAAALAPKNDSQITFAMK